MHCDDRDVGWADQFRTDPGEDRCEGAEASLTHAGSLGYGMRFSRYPFAVETPTRAMSSIRRARPRTPM